MTEDYLANFCLYWRSWTSILVRAGSSLSMANQTTYMLGQISIGNRLDIGDVEVTCEM